MLPHETDELFRRHCNEKNQFYSVMFCIADIVSCAQVGPAPVQLRRLTAGGGIPDTGTCSAPLPFPAARNRSDLYNEDIGKIKK